MNTGKLVQRFLPKQADIDKIFKKIQRKILMGSHVPVPVKEIQAEYLINLYFKDLYFYLSQNRLPNIEPAIQKEETLAEKYILLDFLLFKLVTMPKRKQHH